MHLFLRCNCALNEKTRVHGYEIQVLVESCSYIYFVISSEKNNNFITKLLLSELEQLGKFSYRKVKKQAGFFDCICAKAKATSTILLTIWR